MNMYGEYQQANHTYVNTCRQIVYKVDTFTMWTHADKSFIMRLHIDQSYTMRIHADKSFIMRLHIDQSYIMRMHADKSFIMRLHIYQSYRG